MIHKCCRSLHHQPCQGGVEVIYHVRVEWVGVEVGEFISTSILSSFPRVFQSNLSLASNSPTELHAKLSDPRALPDRTPNQGSNRKTLHEARQQDGTSPGALTTPRPARPTPPVAQSQSSPNGGSLGAASKPMERN
ncbi:hypothetical protein EJ06DRAFT_385639 [Trichodelitschia bisporula]|uniref:Uncharacterized protein n=1 Tax=Trichodelitschia bisporula TaxID=703511 RepID=A0A6G1HZZ7_9PEZI|nr:hypothetical protein EJ06DRAFT_385639 [Trichodelitschia bisporula]